MLAPVPSTVFALLLFAPTLVRFFSIQLGNFAAEAADARKKITWHEAGMKATEAKEAFST